MSPQTVFDIQARLCKSMGYPIRLEILHSLRDGPKCVNKLSELLKQSQSTISRQVFVICCEKYWKSKAFMKLNWHENYRRKFKLSG